MSYPYSDWELRRYYDGALDKRNFDTKAWTLHQLGVSRIVYDTKRGEWCMAQVSWSPLFWVFYLVVNVMMIAWYGLKRLKKDWQKGRLFLPDVYEKRIDGYYRFLPVDGRYEESPHYD